MRRIYLLSLFVLFGACNCGGEENNVQIDMGTPDTGDTSFEETDNAATLGDAAREALCAQIIDEVGDPGDTVACDPDDIVLPSASSCAGTVANLPPCATVANVRTCLEKLYSCNASLANDEVCVFLNYDACAVPADDTPLVDVTGGEKALLCDNLLNDAGGSGEQIDCGGLPVIVPSRDQCITTLNEGAPCGDVGQFAECYAAPLACMEGDRERCWFIAGDDDQCTPPYQGVERDPVGFFTFPPQPVSCDQPGSLQRIPFTFTSNDVFPIVPGDLVNGIPMIPGVTMDASSVGARRTRISDVAEAPCLTDLECGSEFVCATSGLPGAERHCTRQTGVEFVPGSMRADFDPGVFEEKRQLVGVLIENTSGLVGRLPGDLGRLYDENGQQDLLTNLDRASDPARIYRDGVKDFLRGLASVADPVNTLASVWIFAGDIPVRARPLIEPEELDNHWTNDLSVGEALIDAVADPFPMPGNLYQSIIQMLQKDYVLEQYADHEKFLFIFTDGPNEVFDPAASYDAVLAAAESLGVHIYIVHLDAEIDPTLIRDLPQYYAGNDACQMDAACQKPACATDNDCLNYEECRLATIYAETAQDPVTTTSAQYCMPRFNSEGRLGPIDEFADLACRTGGNYMYVSDPEEMRNYWRNLPSTVNGQFSMEADFSLFSDPDVQDGFYRLSGVFLGLIGPRDVTHILSAPGAPTVSVDSREIIRLGRP